MLSPQLARTLRCKNILKFKKHDYYTLIPSSYLHNDHVITYS